MTQSGQGEPAREGIVLPSDGGEPLLPGMTGGSAPQPTRPQPSGPGQPSGPQPSGPQSAAPPGGQAWGQPWGPEQSAAAPEPGQGWPQAPALEWGTTNQPAPWTPQVQHGPGALPPEGSATPSHGGVAPQDPMAAYGSGTPDAAHQAYGQGGDATQLSYGGGGAQQQPYAAPLPPAAEQATQYIPSPAPGDQPATQYIAPAASAEHAATQYIPPAAPADEGATQYIPPVAPGPLPPEASGADTRFLGQAAQPQPGSDAEATQYIAPVTAPYGGDQGGDRQPPAEFDNLFRSAPGGPAAAPPTQQMPPFQQPQNAYPGQPPAYTPQGPGGGGGRRGAQDGGGGRGGRRSGSRVPVIAAAGVGIVVLGIGAGALLSGGGDGGDKGDHNKNVAASAPADSASPSAADDPARPQAVALDKLLADSGGSRASVIKAVADLKACRNQGGAAAALRAAAKQRSDLVSRLSQLAVDQLPRNAELTTALTKAWQASASADNHYAAWADQAAKKNGCKKGQARITPQAQAADRDSGTASTEKNKAARLWNAIAKKYDLTARQTTQL
ncbi:hypothetical protein [Streptomyces sp. NPDC006012]|uniref:hypothetical protein n=1 Tax=Streptomyces sp. NPDC006012 TaxID=3364739 RepID=UPI00369671A5